MTNVGTWPHGAPKGFTHDDDGRLRVVPDEFETVVEALGMIDDGMSCHRASRKTGLVGSTLREINRVPRKRSIYLEHDARDERIQQALDEYEK